MSKKRKKKSNRSTTGDARSRNDRKLAKTPRKPVKGRARRKKSAPRLWIWVTVVVGLMLLCLLAAKVPGYIRMLRAPSQSAQAVLPEDGGQGLSLAEIQEQRLIVDVHEHIQGLEVASIYVEVMDELGIGTMCLMGSSLFTLTLNEEYGFTGYDENNEQLLDIVEAYPGRFTAWPTVNPEDPDKLQKFKDYVSRGATGLKLYTGHGYVTDDNEYIFHPLAMDDPGMLPLYEYCEENHIPVCIHVNPFDNGTSRGKPGFCEEFVAILTRFPDMKVDCPHFMLSSIKSSRLREFLDTFPNLYTDISFGDYFMAAGLKRISRDPEKFRKLFADYPDRIMYATDLVLTKGRRKTKEWVYNQFKAYLDMLSKETYTTPAFPGEKLNGLALPGYLLERVLYKNYREFMAKKPEGTDIIGEFDYDRAGVRRMYRKPGQAFPPPTKR